MSPSWGSPSVLIWSGFIALIFVLLALDLGVFHRKPGVMSTTQALRWTLVWVLFALSFSAVIYWIYESEWGALLSPRKTSGRQAVLEYLTGYLIEKLLSLDNIFVIAVILAAFKVPAESQHRVLYWGILGALVLRGVMIGAGTAALQQFSWLVYPLGLILLITGARMLKSGGGEDAPDVDRNILVRLARLVFPVARDPDPGRFFTRSAGRLAVTPTLLALLAVEATDVLFAVDSVPAVFAVTLDPFLVFTSNILAILGLRSLFFALQSMLGRFRFLKPALAAILGFVGVKILLSHTLPIAPLLSLAVIMTVVAAAVIASVVAERREDEGSHGHPGDT